MSNHNPYVLDQLVFLPPSFEQSIRSKSLSQRGPVSPIPKLPPILSRCLVGKNRVAASSLLLKYLSQHGATVATDEQGMELLSEFKSLHRLLSIPVDSIPSIESLESANSIELQLYEGDPSRGHLSAALPIDLIDLSILRKKVESIRILTQHKVPIGACMIKGDVRADIPLLLNANFDFVTLIDPSTSPDWENVQKGRVPDPWLISHASQLASSLGKPTFAVHIETSIRDGVDLVKCLALGATSIVIDRFLLAVLEQNAAATSAPISSGGLLGDIGRILPSQAANRELQLVKSINKLLLEVELAFAACGLQVDEPISIANLVAIDNETHRLTRAALLSH